MKNLFGQQATRRGEILGCDGCPLDKISTKVKGLSRLKGKRAMLWGSFPGAEDSKVKLEQSGDSGALLWEALGAAGLSRNDFDVQNVLRCRPPEDDPPKQALTCCAVYNDEALTINAERAKVHVILGDIAGKQLLGDALRKDTPVFWHKPWNAYVVYNQDSKDVLRRAGGSWGESIWKERFRSAAAILKNPGRWGYVESRRYAAVRSEAQFDDMEKALRAETKAGRRVSLDVEDGVIDGKRVLLVSGFGTGHFHLSGKWQSWSGKCWSVVVDHPGSGIDRVRVAENKRRLKRLIEDAALEKSLHNGSYDKTSLQILLGAKLRGYTYDTQYGTFLRHSFLRSCSLESLTYLFFPEFADYKNVVDEWVGKKNFGEANYADVPLERLVLRNCGDCDVTKRLEERFSSQISLPLLQVYIHAGITLDKMEGRGPLLDWQNWEAASKAVPEMIETLDRMLCQIADDGDFDCDSPLQVAHLIYDVLKLPLPKGKDGQPTRSTTKDVLELLLAETAHPVLELITKRRAIGKIKSTYLAGYAASARAHGDELRTIWWLTGAVTGRLRSGRGDRAEAEGIVNMQNLHGNAMLQNLLVSDKNWRKALEG